MAHLNVKVSLVTKSENKISHNDKIQIEQNIWNEVKVKLNKQGVNLDFYYNASNQCFCLIALKNEETVQKVINSIRKRENNSSKKQEILGKSTSLLGSAFLDEESNNKMEWKRDIYALGVSESVLESVCNYNQNQLVANSLESFEMNNQYLIQYLFDKI